MSISEGRESVWPFSASHLGDWGTLLASSPDLKKSSLTENYIHTESDCILISVTATNVGTSEVKSDGEVMG